MRELRHYVAACLVVFVAMVAWLPPAGAHTGFESSDPAEGSVVDTPIETVTLVFTGDAEPTGDGFQVLEPNGEVRQPTDVSTADGRTWVLGFDPPLAGGVVGVRWMVKAPDAHPIDGSFSFTAPDLPSPSPAEESVATTVPSAEPADAADPGDTDETMADVDSATPAQAAAAPAAGVGEDPVAGDRAVALDEFLDTGSGTGSTVHRIGAGGRFVTLAGTLLGVGGLIFAATTMRGGRRDVRSVMVWVRSAGLLVVAGAVIELVAQVVIEDAGNWAALSSPSAIGGVVGSTFGVATALRFGGGLALAAGVRMHIAAAADVADPVVAMRELVGARSEVGGDDVEFWGGRESIGRRRRPSGPLVRAGDHAWRSGIDSAGAVVGGSAIVAAHLFDGHTVTKGNRILTGVIDVIHVVGGAVWAGGVVMLMSVLWLRHREGRELRARQLAVRFSVVATVALVVVGGAGVILTVIVLDSPSELWATEWGRILIAKITFVGIAALAGGYNHKILIPLMDAAPGDNGLSRQFRNVVTGEAIALVAVVIATAFLMGAAS